MHTYEYVCVCVCAVCVCVCICACLHECVNVMHIRTCISVKPKSTRMHIYMVVECMYEYAREYTREHERKMRIRQIYVHA